MTKLLWASMLALIVSTSASYASCTNITGTSTLWDCGTYFTSTIPMQSSLTSGFENLKADNNSAGSAKTSAVAFAKNGVTKWTLGQDLNGTGNEDFFLWDNAANSGGGALRWQVDPTGLFTVNYGLTVNGTAAFPNKFTSGTGSHSTFAYTNDLNVGAAPTIFPSTVDTTGTPALAIERSTHAGNPSNKANETLFVGTHLDIQSPGSWTWGINNEMQVDHNAGANGVGSYGEASRSDCEIASTIEQSMSCWGAVFRSGSNSTTVNTYNIGVEAEADKNINDAPLPGALNSTWFNTSFIASGGTPWGTGFLNDAAFLVNNFTKAGGFQAGFSCPRENDTTLTASISGTTLTLSASSTALYVGESIVASGVSAATHIVSGSGTTYVVDVSQTVSSRSMVFTHKNIANSCFFAASRSTYGIDISQGTWSGSQIHGVNYDVTPAGDTWGNSFAATGTAVTTFAGQIGYGGTTVGPAAVGTTCPSGTIGGQTVVGCEVHNVHGRVSYVPYF